jgi:hygromycin-B 7''-O-kinase
MVQTLHSVPVGRVTTMDTRREAWVTFVEQQATGAVAHHWRNGSLPEHLLAQLPDYLAGALPLFPPDFRPTIINCDLTCDHVLLTEQDEHWHITGLIDFGDVQVGHVDYEWVALHLSLLEGDRDLLRAFLRAYGWEQVVDERFSRRMMAYSLLHLFSDMRPFVERLGGPERVRQIEELEAALWRL